MVHIFTRSTIMAIVCRPTKFHLARGIEAGGEKALSTEQLDIRGHLYINIYSTYNVSCIKSCIAIMIHTTEASLSRANSNAEGDRGIESVENREAINRLRVVLTSEGV